MATTLPPSLKKGPSSPTTAVAPPDSAISVSASSNLLEDEELDTRARPQPPPKSYTEPSQAVYRPTSTSVAGPSTQPQQYTTPPPYSGPLDSPSSSSHQPPKQTYPGLPPLNYPLYHPPSFTLSPDTTTLSSSSPHLQSLPVLLPLLHQLAALPPKPQIRIVGKNGDRVDFDVKINCMGLFVPDGRGGDEWDERKRKMNYLRVIGKTEKGWRGERGASFGDGEELGIEGWVEKFLRDGRGIKSFTLERQIANWDITYLQGRLLTLINSTSYHGSIAISFPITHSKVTIHSPPKINTFFSTIEKIFTGTRKYEVLKSVWPYADIPREMGGRSGEFGNGRRCVVQDEEEWFLGWRDAIRHAVVGRRRGWVTIEDRLEFLMEPAVGEGALEERWVDG